MKEEGPNCLINIVPKCEPIIKTRKISIAPLTVEKVLWSTLYFLLHLMIGSI